MADENTEIQEQTQETTPQQQSIQFEDILPWGTTGGDTGLSSRLKLKRNFEKIKAWMDSIALYLNFDDKYLSKTKDDEAAGLITFAKGLISTLTASFGDYQRTPAHGGDAEEDSGAAILPDGTGDFINLIVRGIVKGNLTIEELLTARDIIFRNTLQSEGARRGFTDGKGIYMNAMEGLIEADGMNLRGFLRAMEVIINRLQLMESDYSFTEGDTVEHVDYEDNGQTLVLTMHKDHDNDYTPFYPGDIIYGIRNDLLANGVPTPEGHTATRNGSYFKTWMRVKSVDLGRNQIRAVLYEGKYQSGTDPDTGEPVYTAIVPGGMNFSPYGTGIKTDITAPMLAEYNTIPEGASQPLGVTGYDTMLTVTRHGNIADGIDPDTGQYDEHIHQSQLGRQQAWVLSTTDKRLSFFWNVDTPIIKDEFYALCLGILPDLANLPTTRNPEMPSLYINTLFADNIEQANYPARVVKTDRGQWTSSPTATYDGEDSGTWTPDNSTVTEGGRTYGLYVKRLGQTGGKGISSPVAQGDTIIEPYHYRTFTKADWLSRRLSASWARRNDATLEKILLAIAPKADLEVSRVWKGGKLWECLVDGTAQEPFLGCTDWLVVSGNTVFVCEISTSNGNVFHNGNVDTNLTMRIWWGDEDVTELVMAMPHRFTWSRLTGYDTVEEQFVQQSEDLTWEPDLIEENKVHLLRGDMGSGWMITYQKALIRCEVSFSLGEGQEIERSTVYRF